MGRGKPRIELGASLCAPEHRLRYLVQGTRGDWPSVWTELAAAVRGGTPPPVTAREARNTTAVIEAIAESSRTGRRVTLG